MNHPSPGFTAGTTTDRRAPADPDRSRHRRRSRLLALVLPVVVLALASCQPKVWPVQVPYLNNADAAAEWLVSDFEERGHLYGAGPLADTILGLAAAGADRELADPVVDALEAATPAYTQPGGNVNPGATAKVLLAVQAARADGNDFAGLDLEAALRSTMETEGPDAGRFGTSNAFTQPLAMLALARTPGGIPPESAQWLAGVQCPDGSFSWGNCNFSDADHTGLAAQGLIAAGGHQADVQAAAAWLVDVQLPDGSFNAGSGAGNANSTGLAVPALRVTGHHAEAEAAAQFVKDLQYGPDAGPKAGAIPWTATIDSSLQLATTQGVLAWGAGPYHLVAFPAVKGEACADEDGVTVIVDLARHDNTIRVSCAVGDQATGWAALESAGFTVGSVPGYEGQAICTIDDAPAEGYPTCWNDGFWAYFHDEDRSGEWEFSSWGAADRTPPPGSVEGWRYEPSWATHTAAAPGVSPLVGATCARPQAPTFDIIDDDEVLTFVGPWGASVEVAVLPADGPVDGAEWVETSTLALTGLEGRVRVIARSTGTGCPAQAWFHHVYDVRDTYAPNANDPTSPAVPATSPDIVGWATGHSEYTPGANVAETWQVPERAYGPPTASPVVLGDDGTITLTFDTPITDGVGHDLAVFENGFSAGATDFLEVGYVEVSSNGTDFVRFDSASRRETPVGGFTTQLASELGGLAGKDFAGRGTPFDLAVLANKPAVLSGLVDLSSITHVRIVDIVGDGGALDSFGRPIYDPHPTTGSAGFDLTGLAVLNTAG